MSIFLSHNSQDKPFARKLKEDLNEKGYYVWLDEAEIKLGDSLIEKIREGIDKVTYVGVILSSHSINSEWVKREVDIAMNQEIEGKKIKVLPLLLEKVDLPGFLKGKLYADFTSDETYHSSLKLIMSRLDEVPTDQQTLTKEQSRAILANIEKLRQQLEITDREKGLLTARLALERKNIPQQLQTSITREKKSMPDFDDINQNFAFMCNGMDITAGYVLHGLRKERIKGGPHQIAMWCDINGKTNELSLLVEAIFRRLQAMAQN